MSVTRCGLDLEHEPHEHPLGSCDGHVLATPDAAPGDPVSKLFTVSGVPLAWNWASLTLTQARELRDLLDAFVADYNRAYAVRDGDLIPGCWPLHEGLARELAALYAQWVHVHQSGLAPAEQAVQFYDKLLPGFKLRLPGWLGAGEKCNPTVGHRPDWNQAEPKRDAAAKPGMDARVFDDAVEAALLAYTRS